MTTQHKKQKISAATLFAIATFAVYGAALRSRPGNAARLEMLTAQQAADRSAPICRLLATKQTDMQQVTEALMCIGHDGKKHKMWVVDCIDNQGNHVVHTVWNAETGGLVVASHCPQRGANAKTVSVPAGGAAKVAWHWLEAVGVGRMAPSWTVSQLPQLSGDSWRVALSSPQYHATVIFDTNTRDLIYLAVKELPSAPIF